MNPAPKTHEPVHPARTSAAEKTRRRFQLHAIFRTQLSSGPSRIRLLVLVFFILFGAITGKLIYLGMKADAPQTVKSAAADAISSARPDIIDRNGDILATDKKVMSIFAEPKRIIDKDEAVELLTAVLPDVSAKELRERRQHRHRRPGACDLVVRVRLLRDLQCRLENSLKVYALT